MELQFLTIIPKAGPLLLGALYTIFVGILACGVGILVGTGLLLMRNSRFWLLRTWVNIGPFTAGIMSVGFNSGAFIAEILRGGLSRIPKGQREAAESLGLPRIKVWFKVILPQVFHSVIPLLVNEFTMVIKITPLLSTITVVELTRASQMLYNETFRPVEVLVLAAVIYFIICFSISQLGEYLQRRSHKFRL